MENKRIKDRYKLFMKGSIFAFLLSSAAICLIPFLTRAQQRSAMSVLLGVLFWLGIIAGGVLIFLCSRMRKNVERIIEKPNESAKKKIGFISFKFSIGRIILYAVCVIGLVLIVTDLIFEYATLYLMAPIISLTFFAWVLHCILDGKNYYIYSLVKEGKKG